jgi:DNA-binding transcriptional regulator YdaS (Cro superfamily)
MIEHASIIDLAIERAGGVTKLSQALAIGNPSVVANWRTRGRIPAERVIEVERITGIPREQIRPDIFRDAKA